MNDCSSVLLASTDKIRLIVFPRRRAAPSPEVSPCRRAARASVPRPDLGITRHSHTTTLWSADLQRVVSRPCEAKPLIRGISSHYLVDGLTTGTAGADDAFPAVASQ